MTDLYPSRGESAPCTLPRFDPVVHSSWHEDAPLTKEQTEKFDRDGYLVLDNVFTPEEVSSLQDAASRILSNPAALDEETVISEPGINEIRSVFMIHNQSEAMQRLAADERLAGVARFLLGDDIYIHQSRLNYKPGFVGKEFYWHSDFETWHVEDGMPQMRALSMSILLAPNSAMNAPLMIIPGSHRKYCACVGDTPEDHYLFSLKKQEFGVPDKDTLAELATEGGIAAATGRAGSVVIFDCNAMHGSNGNITPFPRANAFFVYNAVSNRLVSPYGPEKPRPEFIAARQHTPVLRSPETALLEVTAGWLTPAQAGLHSRSFEGSMIGTIKSVGTLLLAIFMLMAGSGFLATLISLRLEAAGEPSLIIGLVATAYFGGLMIGSILAFRIVARVGHIRAFAAFVSLFSATSLSYAIYLHPIFWSLLRLTEGFCMAGVFICLESWLNERAEPETRGSILSFYMISLYAGQAIGQFLLNLGDTWPSMPFIAASILLSLAVIPVTLTRIAAPALPEGSIMRLGPLYGASPLGVVGAGATGMMMGAFYGLGAVFARGAGLIDAGTALFMSATILGGVALQWPLGRLSDLIDRRKVIFGAFVATLAICATIVFLAEGRHQLMLAGALFGGAAFALYPLCVAHTNDHLGSKQRVAASGGLVLVYSLGAAAGPLPAAAVMDFAGARGLFLFIGVCAAVVVAFASVRLWIAPPVPGERQRRFLILPRTTPLAANLDPLSPDNS